MTNDYPRISLKNASDLLIDFKNMKIDENKIKKYTNGKFLNEESNSTIIKTLYRIGELANEINLNPNLNNASFDTKASIILHKEAQINIVWARDPDFWRWIVFTEDNLGASLVDRRYGKNETRGNVIPKYYQFNKLNDGFFSYLWMRANCVYDVNAENPYSYVEFEDLIFWNYILGTELCTHKNLIQALIKFIQLNNIIVGDPQDKTISVGYRDMFMELRRRSNTIALDLFSKDQAYSFLEEIWNEKHLWSKNYKESD